MPFSSGTYSLPSGNPVVTGTTISSSTTNTTNSDIATALSSCILKDGTQTVTADIPMASHKITGLAAPTTAGDALSYGSALGTPASGVVTNLTGTASININGTVGATTATTGAFTTLAYTGTLTGSTGILNIGSGQVYKDASGNVGIGTSSPTQKLTAWVAGTLPSVIPNCQMLIGDTSTFANTGLALVTAVGNQSRVSFGSTASPLLGSINYDNTSNYMYFTTNSTERMRIDSSGNVGIGTTTQRNGTKTTIEQAGNLLGLSCSSNLASVDFALFYANAGTICGAISRVGVTSAVVYTATSDYRLKENVQPFINALETVAKLNPVTYVWKDCGIAANGFIAHELQEVCPDAVVGTKDEIDADGNPKYQSIDQSKIVALLTKAIQEQQTLIEALTARLTALEAK